MDDMKGFGSGDLFGGGSSILTIIIIFFLIMLYLAAKANSVCSKKRTDIEQIPQEGRIRSFFMQNFSIKIDSISLDF